MPARYSCREGADPAPLAFLSSMPIAPNRFLKAALSKQLINLYCNRGKSGWGIIFSGSTPIAPAHLEAAGDPIISLDHNPEDGDERFEA
ncbi:NADH:flavin oxidoreductase/NADH oxidase [Colletotrichum plurivorum]|uniref:NADH:flavin oxidoreductase/NADH oxidase n=1 Tax=Colletotrichum plurivorum TaxID=2175906 RepID=A0A8H6NNA7_9PEZI|nr:NADH:flavin oxidoreductase/NADH oxidase [Colletotrichum plurivorum]